MDELVPQPASGRTFLSKGYVREARKHIEKNIEILSSYADDGLDVVDVGARNYVK